MITFTDLVATMVVQSSALALAHFGVTVQPAPAPRASPPPAERVIARTPVPQASPMRLTACPAMRRHAHPLRA